MKTIALFNPSSPSYEPFDIEKIKVFLQNKGFEVKESAHLFEYERFLNGTDEQRAEEVMSLFCDEKVDILLALKGGYGSGRILDLLDYDKIRANSKMLIGFSDTTALQLGLYARAGLASLTGFSPKRDIACREGVDSLIDKTLMLALQGKSLSQELCAFGYSKDIEGIMIGGTLCLLDELIGTPYCPDLTDKILFLEEVAEEPYKVDRMLTHLRLAGVFDRVAGVVWGDFYKCVSKDENDGLMLEVLQDLRERCPKVPMWSGLSYGHSDTRLVLPIGVHAEIKQNLLSFTYALK